MRFALPPTLGLRNLLDAFLRMLTETDTTLTEFCSSTSLLAIGLVLLFPMDTLQRDVPLLRLWLDVLPNHFLWAFVFLIIGGYQSVANVKHKVYARRGAAFMAFVFFGFFGALAFVRSPTVLILGILFAVQSFTQGLVYLHLGLQTHAGGR
jgi:hypothetical protein